MFDLPALSTSLAQALTPASTLGWVIAGMVILFALKRLMDRAGQPTGSIARVLEEAARLNAARAAPPSVDHSPVIANVTIERRQDGGRSTSFQAAQARGRG